MSQVHCCPRKFQGNGLGGQQSASDGILGRSCPWGVVGFQAQARGGGGRCHGTNDLESRRSRVRAARTGRMCEPGESPQALLLVEVADASENSNSAARFRASVRAGSGVRMAVWDAKRGVAIGAEVLLFGLMMLIALLLFTKRAGVNTPHTYTHTHRRTGSPKCASTCQPHLQHQWRRMPFSPHPTTRLSPTSGN